MALIPYPDPKKLSPKAQEILALVPQNLVRMFSGLGELFVPMMALSNAFHNHSALTPTLRELATCRIGHRYEAAYMLDQHALMARTLGVTEAKLEAVSGPLPSPEFSPEENAALLLIDGLIDNIRVPANLILDVYNLLGETELHELFYLYSKYDLAARYTESLQIDLDAAVKGNATKSTSKLAELFG